MSREKRKSKKSPGGAGSELIVNVAPKSLVSEAFRHIRSNLSFISPDRPLKTIVITSSVSAEGKSLILANLALAEAQGGNEVIIIDADLRKPKQHDFFGMANIDGLSSILKGKINFEEGLRGTGIERIRLISAGVIPPNPAELLNSNSMENLLKRAGEEADIVFVDTPPVIPVTDAAILSNRVDGTILLAASHQTDERLLIQAKENLERAHAHIIGVILNKYPVHQDWRYQYYYY